MQVNNLGKLAEILQTNNETKILKQSTFYFILYMIYFSKLFLQKEIEFLK